MKKIGLFSLSLFLVLELFSGTALVAAAVSTAVKSDLKKGYRLVNDTTWTVTVPVPQCADATCKQHNVTLQHYSEKILSCCTFPSPIKLSEFFIKRPYPLPVFNFEGPPKPHPLPKPKFLPRTRSVLRAQKTGLAAHDHAVQGYTLVNDTTWTVTLTVPACADATCKQHNVTLKHYSEKTLRCCTFPSPIKLSQFIIRWPYPLPVFDFKGLPKPHSLPRSPSAHVSQEARTSGYACDLDEGWGQLKYRLLQSDVSTSAPVKDHSSDDESDTDSEFMPSVDGLTSEVSLTQPALMHAPSSRTDLTLLAEKPVVLTCAQPLSHQEELKTEPELALESHDLGDTAFAARSQGVLMPVHASHVQTLLRQSQLSCMSPADYALENILFRVASAAQEPLAALPVSAHATNATRKCVLTATWIVASGLTRFMPKPYRSKVALLVGLAALPIGFYAPLARADSDASKKLRHMAYLVAFHTCLNLKKY